MFGIRFIKLDPTVYGFHYKNGKVVKEGKGLAMFYYAPTATIVAVPLNTIDLPFAFNEVTADYQKVMVQGQLNYRVTDPNKLAGLLNYAVTPEGRYLTNDPGKLGERLIHAAQGVTRGLIQGRVLKEVLPALDRIKKEVFDRLAKDPLLGYHGIELVGLDVIAVRPEPEMAKALEAAAREALQGEADEAIYARRKAAVEQERVIQETELETEKAVEEKKREIRETQMDAEIAVEQKKRLVRETQIKADIAVEEERTVLTEKQVLNHRKQADAKAYELEKIVKPIKELDWHTLMALGPGGLNAEFLIAHAFDNLANNAQKIGNLQITPDLLNTLMGHRK